jgi:ubiquinone/menaquinone biosynthesis C-methylase UbiE
VDEATTVESMRDYYAQRAAYYERVYLKPERQRDLRTTEARLPSMFVGRRVLEVACGTGCGRHTALRLHASGSLPRRRGGKS